MFLQNICRRYNLKTAYVEVNLGDQRNRDIRTQITEINCCLLLVRSGFPEDGATCSSETPVTTHKTAQNSTVHNFTTMRTSKLREQNLNFFEEKLSINGTLTTGNSYTYPTKITVRSLTDLNATVTYCLPP
jgi:hypothetical protein